MANLVRWPRVQDSVAVQTLECCSCLGVQLKYTNWEKGVWDGEGRVRSQRSLFEEHISKMQCRVATPGRQGGCPIPILERALRIQLPFIVSFFGAAPQLQCHPWTLDVLCSAAIAQLTDPGLTHTLLQPQQLTTFRLFP